MKKYRQEQILRLLAERSSLQIGDLASMFQVSPMTIRRDLNELSARGALLRTHGGALPAQQSNTVDTPFSYRQSLRRAEKLAIAEAAMAFVHSGQKLFLSSGSTLYTFSQVLAEVPGLSIVTDAVNTACDLAAGGSCSIVMIGGELSAGTLSTTGSIAERTLSSFYFDAAFIGVTAVGADGQLYLGSISELGIMQQLFSITENIYVLADSSKLGKTDFVRFGRLRPSHTLITDAGIDGALLQQYRSLNIHLVVAPPVRPAGL